MSRSYKKNPYCGDNKGKIKKRFANKTVRQWLKDNPTTIIKGNSYKKIYEQYDICDYKHLLSWESYWKKCLIYHKRDCLRGYGSYLHLNKKEKYKYWIKVYRNK